MNMKKYVIIIITALTVVSLTAGAQAKKWTLQECIDYAVENSIALRQAGTPIWPDLRTRIRPRRPCSRL